jgi:hypothetical protein
MCPTREGKEVDLTHCSMLSDQAVALCFFCKAHGIREYACLRHLLVPLGKCPASFAAGELAKYRSDRGFVTFIYHFRARLKRSYQAGTGQLLGKAGLSFNGQNVTNSQQGAVGRVLHD